MALYWLIEWRIYKRLVLPWQQLGPFHQTLTAQSNRIQQWLAFNFFAITLKRCNRIALLVVDNGLIASNLTQTLPETPFQIPLYWQGERHVYELLVLPWQQLISNHTRDNSANENAWSSVSWFKSDLTWRTLVKWKLEFNLLPSWCSVSWRPSWLNFGETRPKIWNIIKCMWHVITVQTYAFTVVTMVIKCFYD